MVAGSGRARLDDEVVELSVWDVLRVAPAVIRSFEAGPDGLDVICIGGRKPRAATPSGSTTSGRTDPGANCRRKPRECGALAVPMAR